MLPLHLTKQNYLLKTSLTTHLDTFGISLPVFPSRTNLKLHISITPDMVKKVITNLHSSKASGPDCVPVMVLKNCKSEMFTYTSCTIKYVPRRVLFSRLLEGLVVGLCI